jgi:protein involved in polysaccharide export with SLBB domain
MIQMRVTDVIGRWGAVSVLLGSLVLGGCGTPAADESFSDPGSGNSSAVTGPAAGGPGDAGSGAGTNTTDVGTKLQVGDAVTVTFADLPPPQPTPFEVRIHDNGTITLLHNQEFKALGKTPGELEKDIWKCYVPRFYPYMTVTVTPTSATRFYYVDGEVMRRDRQVYISRITVLKAIASAGGFTDFANKRKVKLTRVNGRTSVINCIKAIDHPELDLEVFPGDRIWVPRRPI